MLNENISIDDLVSAHAETEEDIFSGKFCECGHLLTEHCAGKCYSFNHNGANFWSCFCKKVKPMQFKIKVEIYAKDIINNNNNNIGCHNGSN